MRKNKTPIILFLSALLALPGLGQESVLEMLSYNNFISSVKTQHPLAKKAGNLVSIAKYQQRGAKGLFDPYVSAEINNKFFSGTDYYNTAFAEIKQPVYTGQTIKAGVEYGQGAYINPQEYTPSQGLPYLGIEFAVLQGLVIDQRRYEVEKSKHYKNILESESNIQLNDLLFIASDSYVDWLKDYTLTEINSRYIETARQRFQGLIALSLIGERPPIDTVESAILIQTREIDYGATQMHLNKALYQLNSFRWLNDSNLLSGNLTPATSLNDLEEKCLSDFLKKGQLNFLLNPSLQYYGYRNNLLKLEKKYKAELIKPKLDLKYNFLGNATGNTNAVYTNNYKWGAGFAMPILLRKSVNDYKIAKLNLQSNELELNNKSAELNTKLIATNATLKLLAEQIQIAKRTFRYSQRLLEAEKMKFDNNESSLFLLNTRESKVLDSEIKLTELQAKFISNYFYLIYLTGDLSYNID